MALAECPSPVEGEDADPDLEETDGVSPPAVFRSALRCRASHRCS
ncbi:hypothetical protein [Halalkalicoccus ordinarius]